MTDQTTTTTTESELAGAMTPEPVAQASQTPQTPNTTQEPPKSGTQPAAPQPKYTEEELTQRLTSVKGGYEGTTKELKTVNKQLKEQIAQIREDAKQAEYTRLMADPDAEPQTVNLAKRLQEDWKMLMDERKKLDTDLAEWEPKLAELNEMGKHKKAYDLAQEHGLETSAVEELKKAETREAMEIMALKLAIEKARITARPPASPSGTIPSTQGRDLSKLSDTEKLGFALEEALKNR